MKSKINLLGLLIIPFSSCTPKYLPSSSQIDINEYGSYIEITLLKGKQAKTYIDGELIAIDSSTIVLLEEKTRKCETVLVSDIKHFELRYAKPKRYYWTIPICAAYPLIHGFYAALTIPIHLIVTTIVTATGEAAFKYRDEGITYENLRMFARFPQGIPPGVELADIKWNMPAR